MPNTNTSTTNNIAAKVSNKLLLKRIYALAKPYKFKLYTAIVLTMCMSFLGPLRPFVIQYTIDKFIATNNLTGLINMSLLLLVMLIMQAGMQVVSTIFTNYLAQNVIKDLRMKVYDYLTGLRLLFYDKTPIGTMVTRTVNDIETIADVFSEGLINISGDILQIVFILIFMFSTNWQLSLVSLSVLPFLFYAGYVFKEKVRLSFEDVRTQVARLNTFVQEHIMGMHIVQIFNREQKEYSKFKHINAQHRDANINSVMYYSVFFPVVEIIAALSTALIVWYGAKGVIQDQTSIGTITAFIMYINLFFRPIRQLADRFNTMQMGMVAADRIFKLIDNKQNIEPNGHVKLNNIEGNIEFRQVYFGYTPNQYVLKDINITLHKGKTVALIGATGAGKSSIINLLSRFYEIEKGEILIDGHSLKNLDLKHLRKHIAVVLQDVFLFSGSVMDNIKLNNHHITDEAVIATSKLLGAHDFIVKLPQGYNQNIQERGASLSVGQRQLISFVRAMVTNPTVLILDEATSSVDNETEDIIQNAIETMMKGRTSIVIAHRLSTIQHADEIIVLDNGMIVERGSHRELLNTDGYYKKLYELQFITS
ncbi:MAG: ABC transporter ATP-binding protein [Bacteroidia bacterium]|nr:ABC transporter ATP-binding protein [Bacteroidia bacterium]MBP9688045.1 ABC transporter ATP-binding protein [Bacteroidia bacterium]